MNFQKLISNKFSISIFILLALLLTDILLHRGESRILLPNSFTDNIKPYRLRVCDNKLTVAGKKWVNAVQTKSALQALSNNSFGFETRIEFFQNKNQFYLSNNSDSMTLEELLSVRNETNSNSSICFTIVPIASPLQKTAIVEMNRLKLKYALNSKIIIAADDALMLRSFCDSGYYTAYRVPAFNPYQEKDSTISRQLNTLKETLEQYPAAALLCDFIEYPFLRRFFPDYKVITTTHAQGMSLVGYVANRQMLQDSMIPVIFYPE